MTADVPIVRRSPGGTTEVGATQPLATADGVELRERPFLRMFDLRLDPTPSNLAAVEATLSLRLPTEPNTTAVAGDLRALWLGPDEWLLEGGDDRAADDSAERLDEALRAVGGSSVDVSAHRTTLELRGGRAREILESGCSIDLHPRAFDVGRVVQAPLARVDVILVHVATDTYHVLVRTSFARYLVDWLRQAIAEVTAAT